MNKKLRIYLGDLSYLNIKSNYDNITNPLSVAYIGTYLMLRYGNDIEINIFKDPVKLVDACNNNIPDLIGLSFYTWNTNLNHNIVKFIKNNTQKKIYIVWGGPSVDTDIEEQKSLFKRFTEVDFFVENEGEAGMSNIIKSILSKKNIFENPIDGATFKINNEIIKGKSIGLSTDLHLLDSPYLNGLMDPFIKEGLKPTIQTSRLCPYTCSFCVSGKNKGKIRAFDLDLVNEEIKFIAKKYSDKPNRTLYLTDENFGVLDRDVEVATMIKKSSIDYKYPKTVSFYNDKRFTERSRKIVGMLGPMTQYGMILALQSENPAALKAANRRNITSSQIDDNIKWATENNLNATTELIFGLPGETYESFKNVMDRSVQRGFDSVLCNNLYLVDGIEMNRPDYIKEHNIGTHFRSVADNAGIITVKNKENEVHDLFCAELQRVVTSSKNFTHDEYLEIRLISFFYYAVFTLRFYRPFFQFLCKNNISLSKFAVIFLTNSGDIQRLDGHKDYINKINDAIKNELFDSENEAIQKLKEVTDNEGFIDPQKINLYYGTKLIYESGEWLDKTLINYLDLILDDIDLDNRDEIKETGKYLIALSSKMRIDLFNDQKINSIETKYDIPKWIREKFKKSIFEYKIPVQNLRFVPNFRYLSSIKSLRNQYSMKNKLMFSYTAVDSLPRSILVHELEI